MDHNRLKYRTDFIGGVIICGDYRGNESIMKNDIFLGIHKN